MKYIVQTHTHTTLTLYTTQKDKEERIESLYFNETYTITLSHTLPYPTCGCYSILQYTILYYNIPVDAIPVRTNTGIAPVGSSAVSRLMTRALLAVSPKRDRGPGGEISERILL